MMSIVIPTWNGCALVCACLRSLRDQTFQDFEVIVVDDGSTDDTVMKLEEDYPEAQCVSLTQSRGFSVATNAGIRRATGTWVFLLNNDMTLEADCLARLMAGAADEVSMVAPLVLWQDERKVVYSAGDLMRTSGRPESHGFRVALADLKVPAEIFGVSAGAGLFRKALFDEIGLLDESFTAYFEDSDLCFRARLAGHNAALVVEAVAYHIGSASIVGKTWWRTRQCFQNHGLLVIKNMPLALVWRHGGAIAGERFHQAGRLFSAARAEGGTLWACWIFACSVARLKLRIPRALLARLRTRRKIGIAELDRMLTK